MDNSAILSEAEPRKIVETLIKEKVPGVMTYLSRGKWHAIKVLLTRLGASVLEVEVSPRNSSDNARKKPRTATQKPQPLNICIEQPVGLSIKHGHGKFIFETKITGFEPSDSQTSGGAITVAVPEKIELLQRRSYFRVEVPKSLKVKAVLWHRRCSDPSAKAYTDKADLDDNPQNWPSGYWQAELIDVSAGGGQIVIDAAQQPDFKRGQFIGLRFTPMPYETPLLLNAQIRHILPTADGRSLCYGLQFVGLEASQKGRETLQRLCKIVEQYYQMSHSQETESADRLQSYS